MQLPLSVSKASGVPIQTQIVSQIRDLIDRGFLPAGGRVPSTRELSEQLSVARRTIMLAYDKLVAEGYLEPRRSAATVVSAHIPQRAIHVAKEKTPDREVVRWPVPSALEPANNPNLYLPNAERCELDFRIGRPDRRLFPEKAWHRLMSEKFAAHARVISEYPDPQGHLPLRAALCEQLRVARGIECTVDQIVIVSGVQDGLNLAGRLLHRPRAKCVVEDPCYNGAAAAFETVGLQLVPTRVDGQGIVVGDWPEDARLVYVTPSHQFPYGMTMSVDRRRELLSWASASGAYILEDDYDSDFRYNSSPLLALKAMDHAHRVVYLGTFSKSIGPGLRVGYAVFPKHLADAARALKATMSNGLPVLEQSIITQFLESGAFERHLVFVRRQYHLRRDKLISLLLDAFPDTEISGAEGGMHLVWSLDDAMPPAMELARACREVGVGIYAVASSPFCKNFAAPSSRDIMLGYTCLTEDQISEAVERMKRVVQQASRCRLRA